MEENAGNLYGGFANHSRTHSGGSIPNHNPGWDLWAPNSSFRINNTSNLTIFTAGNDTAGAVYPSEAAYESLYNSHGGYDQLSLYSGGREGSHLHPDPHLTCLKLGKRQYFGDNFPVSSEREEQLSIGKRIKPYFGGEVGTSSVPRCQVQGCHVGLGNAKDYHRRHKVCEMHSKAPKVVVLGLEQRFCQQCSRFHVVSEFDDSKRSCRRRLAGHNERRRKSTHDSLPRNSSHEKSMSGKLTTEGALSLLSSKAENWSINNSSDISSRSSAALRELIAENRAALLSKQMHHNSINQDQLPQEYQSYDPNYHQFLADPNTQWDRHEAVTLDLMQAPTGSDFGFLSPKHKEEDEVEECSLFWNTWTGDNHD